MARQKRGPYQTQYEGYFQWGINAKEEYKIFAERLYWLMHKKAVTVAELADYLQVSPATISNYTQAVAYPTPDKMINIAKFFGVSWFYLVGESDAESTDVTVQALSEFTGLSGSALEKLVAINQENHDYIALLSALLSSPALPEFLAAAYAAKEESSRLFEEMAAQKPCSTLEEWQAACSRVDGKKRGIRTHLLEASIITQDALDYSTGYSRLPRTESAVTFSSDAGEE